MMCFVAVIAASFLLKSSITVPSRVKAKISNVDLGKR